MSSDATESNAARANDLASVIAVSAGKRVVPIGMQADSHPEKGNVSARETAWFIVVARSVVVGMGCGL